LDKTEETYISETEKETETRKDLRTTERFEMSSETEKTIESESSFEAGVTVTAKYGPVKMQADAGYTTRNAKSKSMKKSSSYAQKITKKSLKRLQKRVKERRETTTIQEVEEINKHEFENDSAGNTVGIYRWVDKIYEAQVANYDQRLMYEFIIPEPAAYYRFMQENKPLEGVVMDKPKDIGQLKPSDIQPDTYQTWVQRYQVEDVSPPPPEFQFIGTAFKSRSKQNGSSTEPKISKELEVPSGYKLKDVQVEGGYTFDPVDRHSVEIDIYVADNTLTLTEGGQDRYDQMAGETGLIPVGIRPYVVNSYALTIHLRCERTSRKLAQWQQATYKAIVKAYKAKKSKYEEQRLAAQSRQSVDISGRNPQRNRELEQEELKKHAISLLRRKRYQNQDAIDTDPDTGAPIIDFESADEVSRVAQFFEQAFEWEQMSYLFYPYFWGSRDSWDETFLLEDDDPLFTKFLRAGAARVVVPVRLDYNEAVLHYDETGEIWNGDGIPAIDDDLYVSLVEELKAETGGGPEGGTDSDTWINRVPTELVRLQKDSSLPDNRSNASNNSS
jgi:hypothetical protein